MRGEEADAALLWQMLGAARRIQERLRGIDYDQYLDDLDAQAIVERQLEIIGEAGGRVSRTFRTAHPEIPWRPMVDQRNIIAHFYYGLDQEKIWNSATRGVVELIVHLERLLPPLPPDPEA